MFRRYFIIFLWVFLWAWLFLRFFLTLLALFRGDRVNGFKLVSMDLESVFGLGLGSNLEHKSVDFISKFWFFRRNGLEPVLLRFSLQPCPGIALLDNPERVTDVSNPIQYFNILCRIDTVDVHPSFTYDMRFLCLYVLIDYFSLNRFPVHWIQILLLGLISLLLTHVQGFEKSPVHILYVLGPLSLMAAIWKNFFKLFMGEFNSFRKLVSDVFLFIGLEKRLFFWFAHSWQELFLRRWPDAKMHRLRLRRLFNTVVKSDSIFVFHLYFYWLN